jgi:acetoin utilization deacetylase AcuC-like enzyme
LVRIAFDPIYAHPLPEGHRFPMLKYELIPGQLLYEGTISSGHIFSPLQCKDEIVLLTHDKEYLDKLHNQSLSAKEQRHIGFPQSPELTKRELIITQGTIDCSLHALKHGVALNIAGGTHHAFRDRGEGFCLLNDFAVATNYLLNEKYVNKILIIDLDVHQGNGTASIFQNRKDVFTFSMHGKHNYPFHKEKSHLDVELLDGTNDETYLSLLKLHLTEILDQFNPDFALFLSGVDILSTDKFGKLAVTMQGCSDRDLFVFESLKKRKIPCCVAMGGGYSPDVKTIVEAHCNTFRIAKNLYE